MVKAPGAEPMGLLAVGRAGSGADLERLRAEGHADMPVRGDVRSVPVPGAVDGWLALHDRYGCLPLAAVMAPAIGLADEGFAASLLLALASTLVADVPGATQLCPNGPLDVGQRVRLPGIARTLRAVASGGREAFYRGEFGRALVALGGGEYVSDDLHHPLAQWVAPLVLRAFGHDLWTVPPPSQGYLTLAGAWIAQEVGLPDDPTDPSWPHLIAEAGRAASFDRPAVLFDGADGDALVSPDSLRRRASAIEPGRPARWRDGIPPSPSAHPARTALSSDGDTTHLCAVDAEGLGISLTQSNALDFGAHLVAGETGVFLHNRGVGFSAEPGHPAAYGPGRRPSHTLSPALVTRPDGSLAQIVGTMGGDVQPQIILQLLARLLRAGEDPATAVSAARVVHEAPGAAPFRLWHASAQSLLMEADVPEAWKRGLEFRGHRVRVVGALNPVDVGCSQIISVEAGNGHLVFTGASDPRRQRAGLVGNVLNAPPASRPYPQPPP
jgi:gamma-glutamyltranspeptidase / glutathione hydrolase